MARGGAGRAVALGLVLRLLFGLRTGLEAAPAPAHTRVQVSDTDTEIDKIFQEENATTTRISTTMENETSFRNVTFTSAGDSSRNPSAYGVIAAAGVLSAILVSATLLILLRLRGQGYLPPPGLLVAVKESLLLSERKTSLI